MKNYNFKNKLAVLNKINVALIGHMGSGKSILGQTIAKKLFIDHIDTDKEISLIVLLNLWSLTKFNLIKIKEDKTKSNYEEKN